MSSVTFTATVTVGAAFSTLVAPAPTKAAHSTSLLAGAGDPTRYNPENPLILMVIQLVIIVALSRILHIFLGSRWLRQPRVLSEILAGVLLGPTAFGRIPGFSAHIFPHESLPYLNLLATIGLVLFLFVVGLDTDLSLIKRNFRPTLAVTTAGMVIPFGLGVALSVGLFKEFINKDDSAEFVPFRNFMLFIATASCITAFPVLARILNELKLTSDPVGVIVLASGVGNDIIGWCLLALSVALSAAAQGQVVVYIILCAVGFTLLLWFVMRPAMDWLGRATGSYDAHAPNQTYMCAVLVLALASAWVMEEIGVSAIFGGFAFGLLLPGPLGQEISHKVEDFVLALLVPLYFSLSGLRTDLGLLNSGIRWGWAICIIAVAFCGKFFGCAIAARFCGSGFTIRECGAIGSLMAAKGLIELVVLNIGLQAGIISQTVFSLYVLEALILTFAATPLALAFYPPHIRRSNIAAAIGDSEKSTRRDEHSETRNRFTIVLERFENLSPLFIFSRLVATPPRFDSSASSVDGALAQESSVEKKQEVAFDTLRLVEMTDRASEAMQASDSFAVEEQLRKDPLSSLYATFASLNGINISSRSLSVVQQAEFAQTVVAKAERTGSDFVLIPWRLKKAGEESVIASYIPNPFESLFGKPSESHTTYTTFLRDLFATSRCDVGLYLDRDDAPSGGDAPGFHRLFLPFHGGSDDRAALELVTQLAKGNRGISVTVLHITRAGEPSEADKEAEGEVTKMDSGSSASPAQEEGPAPAIQFTIQGGYNAVRGGAGETLYPTQHDIESDTADTLALEAAQARSPASVTFSSISTVAPLRTAVRLAARTQSQSNARFTWVIGRGRRDAASHRVEGLELLRQAEQERRLGVCASVEVRKCLGEGGTAALISGVGSNLLVIQSRATGGQRAGKGE